MTLQDIGEFGLIERISARFGEAAGGAGAHGGAGAAPAPRALGIGDDCAVIDHGGGELELVTTDLLIEGSHFLRELITPRQLGRKSLAVNLSDIAAMGGSSRSAFLSVALPDDVSISWIDAFLDGIEDRLHESGARLLGGDTTRSNGPIVIQFTVIGSVARANLKLRSGAEPGDIVCVTDYLGESHAGLRALLEAVPRDGPVAGLIERHLDPRPQLGEGRLLGEAAAVHAMIDLSDGLGSDLRRIMERSGCGAEIEIERLPVSPQLQRVAEANGWQAWEFAVGGGEDYALLCCVESSGYAALNRDFIRAFGRELFAVGRVTENGELRYRRNGEPVYPALPGFEHFRAR